MLIKAWTKWSPFADEIFKCIFVYENLNILLKYAADGSDNMKSLNMLLMVQISHYVIISFGDWLDIDRATNHYLSQ